MRGISLSVWNAATGSDMDVQTRSSAVMNAGLRTIMNVPEKAVPSKGE